MKLSDDTNETHEYKYVHLYKIHLYICIDDCTDVCKFVLDFFCSFVVYNAFL